MARQPPDDIIAAARSAAVRWGVPASISLGQWALESGWGAHVPPDSNNPFGVKAGPGQPAVTCETREEIGGQPVTVVARFRRYPSLPAAFNDHAMLLARGGPYAPARARLPDVAAFCRALTGVYATAPEYGERLAALIHASNLERYDT